MVERRISVAAYLLPAIYHFRLVACLGMKLHCLLFHYLAGHPLTNVCRMQLLLGNDTATQPRGLLLQELQCTNKIETTSRETGCPFPEALLLT